MGLGASALERQVAREKATCLPFLSCQFGVGVLVSMPAMCRSLSSSLPANQTTSCQSALLAFLFELFRFTRQSVDTQGRVDNKTSWHRFWDIGTARLTSAEIAKLDLPVFCGHTSFLSLRASLTTKPGKEVKKVGAVGREVWIIRHELCFSGEREKLYTSGGELLGLARRDWERLGKATEHEVPCRSTEEEYASTVPCDSMRIKSTAKVSMSLKRHLKQCESLSHSASSVQWPLARGPK